MRTSSINWRKGGAASANRPDLRFYPVPFMEIIKKALEEVGKGEQARRYEVMKNTVGLGASLAVLSAF